MNFRFSVLKFFLIFSILVSFTACPNPFEEDDEPSISVVPEMPNPTPVPSLFDSPRTVLENMDVEIPNFPLPEIGIADSEGKIVLSSSYDNDVGKTLLSQTIVNMMHSDIPEKIEKLKFNTSLKFTEPVAFDYGLLDFSFNVRLTKIKINYENKSDIAIIYAIFKVSAENFSENGVINCVIKCTENTCTNKLDVVMLLDGYCFIPSVLEASENIANYSIKNYLKFNGSENQKVRKTLETTKIENRIYLSSGDILQITENEIDRNMGTKLVQGNSNTDIINIRVIRPNYCITKIGDGNYVINKNGNFIMLSGGNVMTGNVYFEESDASEVNNLSSVTFENEVTEDDFDVSLESLLNDVFF